MSTGTISTIALLLTMLTLAFTVHRLSRLRHDILYDLNNRWYRVEQDMESWISRWGRSITAMERTQGMVWTKYAQRHRDYHPFSNIDAYEDVTPDNIDEYALGTLEDWLRILVKQELGLIPRTEMTKYADHPLEVEPSAEVVGAIQAMVQKEMEHIQAQIDLIWEDLEE